MDRFQTLGVKFEQVGALTALGGTLTIMHTDHASPSAGTCDGCRATDVPLMKVSLGRDFFGRVYDRLSPSAIASRRR